MGKLGIGGANLRKDEGRKDSGFWILVSGFLILVSGFWLLTLKDRDGIIGPEAAVFLQALKDAVYQTTLSEGYIEFLVSSSRNQNRYA